MSQQVTPFYEEGPVSIYCGDCVEVMAEMPECSVDAIVTDPPYGLEFMGKEWDRLQKAGHWDGNRGWQGDTKDAYGRLQGTAPVAYRAGLDAQLFHQQWGEKALRVLKPGAHLVSFGGTRTHHRLYCGLEDAGFEIRDTLMWLYGQGFPKSLNISKAIDKMAGVQHPPGHLISSNRAMSGGNYTRSKEPPATPEAEEWAGWGTALKPAWEPILLARKPISEKNIASNVLKWGTGGLDIDGCRIATEGLHSRDVKATDKRGHALSGSVHGSLRQDWYYDGSRGRWPANLVLECTCEEVVEGKAGNPRVVKHNIATGSQGKDGRVRFIRNTERRDTVAFDKGEIAPIHTDPNCPCYMLDEMSGELHSKFAVSKAEFQKSTFLGAKGGADRRDACSAFVGDRGGASRFFYTAKASRRERGHGNNHPTVKPVDVMEWLVTLVSRPGQVILDPFAGSMTTVLAAVGIGRRCIAIEKSEEYCELLRGRCRQQVML